MLFSAGVSGNNALRSRYLSLDLNKMREVYMHTSVESSMQREKEMWLPPRSRDSERNSVTRMA